MAGDHPNPQQIRPSFVGLLLAIVYSLTRLLHKMYITKPTQQLYIHAYNPNQTKSSRWYVYLATYYR